MPGSYVGPGDYHISEGQANIATVKTRDRHDFVIVQEKLDSSNVSAAKVNGDIVVLIRRRLPGQHVTIPAAPSVWYLGKRERTVL